MIPLVILTLNNIGLIHPVCEAIRMNTINQKFYLVFIEQGSKDGTLEYLSTLNFPHKTILRLPQNIGVSKGWNMAIRWIRRNMPEAKYIGFLNSDLRVEYNWLGPMIKVLKDKEQAGMVDNILVDWNNPDFIQSDGPKVVEGLYAFPYHMGKQTNQSSLPVLWGTMACCIFKKEVFDEIGLFDENFLVYSSDFDIQIRMKLAGYEVWHCPLSKARHYTFYTCNREKDADPKLAFYCGRDGEYLSKKWGLDIIKEFRKIKTRDVDFPLIDIHGMIGDYSPRNPEIYEYNMEQELNVKTII
jgi:GT2 family glycosyltransferase